MVQSRVQRNPPDNNGLKDQPSDKSRDHKEDWEEVKHQQLRIKLPVIENPPTTLEPNPENIWVKKIKMGNPQIWRGVLKFLPKFQGVLNITFKSKQTQWAYSICARERVLTIWEYNPPRRPTPSTSTLARARPKNAYRPSNVSTNDNTFTSAWPRMELN